jgi:hypothetical protein
MQSACAVLHGYLWPVELHHNFPHYLINSTIFGKKLFNIKCVFWFFLQFVSKKCFILRKTERDWMKNVYGLRVKYPLFVLYFNSQLIFLMDFRKILKYKILWKCVQWEPSCSICVDGREDGQTRQTDTRNEAISLFWNFVNAHNYSNYSQSKQTFSARLPVVAFAFSPSLSVVHFAFVLYLFPFSPFVCFLSQ